MSEAWWDQKAQGPALSSPQPQHCSPGGLHPQDRRVLQSVTADVVLWVFVFHLKRNTRTPICVGDMLGGSLTFSTVTAEFPSVCGYGSCLQAGNVLLSFWNNSQAREQEIAAIVSDTRTQRGSKCLADCFPGVESKKIFLCIFTAAPKWQEFFFFHLLIQLSTVDLQSYLTYRLKIEL